MIGFGSKFPPRPTTTSRRRFKDAAYIARTAILVATTLVFGASGVAVAQDGAVTLRVSSFHPERAAFSQAIAAWTDEVTKRSEGRITFEHYWGGSLLSAPDTLPGVADGRADLGLTGAVYHPSQLPLSMIDSLPFMSPNAAAIGNAFVEMYETSADLRAEYENSGVLLAGYAPVSVNLFFSKQPIPTMDALQGLRIRTLGLAADALNAAGANPIALPQPQVYESLEKGLLDASFGAGIDLGVDFNFHRLAPHVIDPHYGVWAHGIFVINKGVYDGLDEVSRNIIEEMRREFGEIYIEALLRAEDERCEELKEVNASMTIWPQTEAEKWKAALGDTAREKWLGSQNISDAAGFLGQYEERVRSNEQALEWTGPLERCLAT